MLPAKYRLQLRRTPPFYLFDRKFHPPGFSLYWQNTKDSLPAQTAIVVPKKVAKTAVLRNKTKRVLTAALLQPLAALPLGLKFVIVVRKPDLHLHKEEFIKIIKEKLG